MRSLLMLALVVCALVVCARNAVAEPAPGNATAARQHFRAGEALIKQQRFEEAIRELEAAYDLDPLPEQIYNLAIAHHLRGDDEIAVVYYRMFLIDARGDSKEARSAAVFRASLEKKIADARAVKIQAKLVDAQAKALQSGEDIAEMVLFAQYTADAEAKQHQLAVIDNDIAVNEAERVDLEKRSQQLRIETKANINLARLWEEQARSAPAGGGRARRLVGAVLLAAGTASITMGVHDVVTDASLSNINYSSLYFGVGAASLIAGLITSVSGEVAAKHPRAASEMFTNMQIVPSVASSGSGLTLTAAF